MITVSNSPTVPANTTQDAARIVISQHNGRANGFCTHIEVLPEARPAFKISGNYDLTIEDATLDAQSRFLNLR